MSKWLTQEVCYVNVLAGPIFSLLPVSNHVQVRRVAGGQIIPVRAGFVQDTQLPLFSPNSLCCSCLFCWSNHCWAAELGRFYQSLSEYWVPPPLTLLPRPPNECFQQRCTTISQLPRGTIALTAPKRYNSVSRTQESACRQRVFELKLGKKVFRARSNLRGRSLRSPLSLPMIVFLHSSTSPNKLLLFNLLCLGFIAQKEEHLSFKGSSTNKFLSPKYHTY